MNKSPLRGPRCRIVFQMTAVYISRVNRWISWRERWLTSCAMPWLRSRFSQGATTSQADPEKRLPIRACTVEVEDQRSTRYLSSIRRAVIYWHTAVSADTTQINSYWTHLSQSTQEYRPNRLVYFDNGIISSFNMAILVWQLIILILDIKRKR